MTKPPAFDDWVTKLSPQGHIEAIEQVVEWSGFPFEKVGDEAVAMGYLRPEMWAEIKRMRAA